MKLYDLIRQNTGLKFIDALTGNTYSIADFHESVAIDDRQALVIIYADNLIGSVEVILNFLHSRFTLCLLSPQLAPDFKADLENLYAPYYIYDPKRPEIPGYLQQQVSERISLFRQQQPAVYPIHTEIKLLLSTSGTTGTPKFVKLSERNLVENARSILDFMPVRPTDVTPLNVPVIFVYGLSIFTTNAIAAGKLVCTDKDIMQKEFWTDFDHYGFTSLGGVPYFYEMLNRIGFFKKEHPSLRYMTQTGGILNQALAGVIAAYMKTHQQEFYIMYGQTEASGRMAWLPPADLAEKHHSIGRPVKNGSLRVDPATGELLYAGPNVYGGYATSLAELHTFSPAEVLHTGDLGREDEQGYFYITGRIKRMVKLVGTRFNLDDLERLIKNHFNGETFACVGLDDKYLLVLHLNPALQPEQIRQFLKARLNLHPGIIKVKTVPELPLTPNGKIDYAQARALHLP